MERSPRLLIGPKRPGIPGCSRIGSGLREAAERVFPSLLAAPSPKLWTAAVRYGFENRLSYKTLGNSELLSSSNVLSVKQETLTTNSIGPVLATCQAWSRAWYQVNLAAGVGYWTTTFGLG